MIINTDELLAGTPGSLHDEAGKGIASELARLFCIESASYSEGRNQIFIVNDKDNPTDEGVLQEEAESMVRDGFRTQSGVTIPPSKPSPLRRFRMAHPASVCMTVEAADEIEAKELVKKALTGILDYQKVFASQLPGQPDPDAVIYLVDEEEATVEDIEEDES